MKYVVSVSGGLGSYEALRRCLIKHGKENTHGVFADVGTVIENGKVVSGEDEDLHRFISETETLLDFPITRIKSPKFNDIWDVFFKTRMMGSSRCDPCSRWMKRIVIDDYKRSHFGKLNVFTVLGLGWQERGRINEFKAVFGDACWFPVCEEPFVTNEGISAQLLKDGVKPPRIYAEGFSHNNCGGFCVKMGLYQCYLLWKNRIDRWMFNENKEQEFREYLKRTDITIFRRSNIPLTMREIRIMFEGGWIPKKMKARSCASCMVPTSEELIGLL